MAASTSTHQPYIDRVRSTLRVALCLQPFPSQQVERQSRPEVEFQGDPELLLDPVLITRSPAERCFVEGSINSVRVSLAVKQTDQLDEIITRMLMRFLMQRADQFGILRRVPVKGYDVSFLITYAHLESRSSEKVVDFICDFIQAIDAEVSELKLSVNARARALAQEVFKSLVA
eukprot:CAMPEP_0177771834 /NCGR_PEP_ID=MMETSP0491_2-20121128/11853_1 /TAXON_ID=63592 /ORGANISM="Tetraselmis chuii, Strain PLY429" /LENGTH=173 /DNA_ID=CAMNT_0019289509 /DNA_START=232 /DNA_END=753 /DNA_ORIENTATION=-